LVGALAGKAAGMDDVGCLIVVADNNGPWNNGTKIHSGQARAKAAV